MQVIVHLSTERPILRKKNIETKAELYIPLHDCFESCGNVNKVGFFAYVLIFQGPFTNRAKPSR